MEHLVTREGDLFQVSDGHGDFSPASKACGLYLRDTRFLSRFELTLNGQKAQPLTADASANYVQRVVSQVRGSVTSLSGKATLAIDRQRVLYGGVMYDRIRLGNYGRAPLSIMAELGFDSDFADLFEVRGAARQAHGARLETQVEPSSALLGYRGLDQIVRQVRLRFVPTPVSLTADLARWEVEIPAGGEVTLEIAVQPGEHGDLPGAVTFAEALDAIRRSYREWENQTTGAVTDSDALNRLLERSVADLRMLVADRGQGPFLVAGTPWFAVPFGRDSLIAALQSLAFNPDLARGTLRTMAALQGTEVNEWRREEPGKIPHELRFGEMANLDEIPFRRYYGSVDSTPLFLVLVCEYYAWTGDLELVRGLLPAIDAALTWVDTHGDPDGDGFVEYRADGKALGVQSWKDSNDSMSHRDGTGASSPVAVSEVQGYVYQAKRGLAPILARLGQAGRAARLEREAGALKERFNAAFWMEDRQFPAIALDGQKRQVATVSSDIGHCLWSGIVDEEKAAATAARLVAPDLFSGWGIRTLSTDEFTYNPMSYHNGSVWPHDNSLAVLGLKRCGFVREANLVATALVGAARHFPYDRLPELYCGFDREEGAPVPYPVACSPQAWAAATPLALIHAFLGLEPDAAGGALRLNPSLPEWLGQLSIQGLRVGGAVVDLNVTHSGVTYALRKGQLDICVEESV